MTSNRPLVLDCHDLSRRPGTMREFARMVPAPADLGTPIIGIPEGSDLTLGLRVESVLEGVLVTGAVQGIATGECSRCLEPVTRQVTCHIQELFVYPERMVAARDAGDESVDDETSTSELVEDTADLEPAIRDSVVIALPFKPLCRPDCPGLCPECGARLADNPDHRHDVLDPRWSALHSMLEGMKETKES